LKKAAYIGEEKEAQFQKLKIVQSIKKRNTFVKQTKPDNTDTAKETRGAIERNKDNIMTSTLKRTLTDIMEDELYSPSSSQSHSYSANSTTNNFGGSVSAFGNPSGLQHLRIDQFPSYNELRHSFNSSSWPHQVQSQQQQQDDLSRYLHLNGSQDSFEQSDGTHKSTHHRSESPEFVNCDTVLKHSQVPVINNTSNNELQFKSASMRHTLSEPNTKPCAVPFGVSSQLSDKVNSASSASNKALSGNLYSEHDNNSTKSANFGNLDDEVIMVPQDDYLFDQNDSQYYPNVLQFGLGDGKPLPGSDELNVFKSNDVYPEDDFSEDDDDDDDQNKMDSMDWDDLSSESSVGDDNTNVGKLVTTPGHFRNSPEFAQAMDDLYNDAGNSESIYTLPFGNVGSESTGKPGYTVDASSNLDETLKREEDGAYPSRFRMPDVANQAIEKAKVVTKRGRPVSNKRQKRVKAKAPILRKARNVKTHADESRQEEHVCTIINPKTGMPCNKRFSRPYDLVRHQNTIHAPKRCFYRCMFCEDDLRRKHRLDSNNDVVLQSNYRNSKFSMENSRNNMANSHNSKKVKASSAKGGYLSNKTFSRCDALTRHLRFRHGLNNEQVNDAMDYAKKHVEYYVN